MGGWQRGLVATLVLLALAKATGVSSNLDRWITDTHWRWGAARSDEAFPEDILVVAIDDRTNQKLGRLRYWSRARYAALLGNLRLARAVGIDILFTEPDAVDTGGDTALAEALAENGKTAIVFHQWYEARTVTAEVQNQVGTFVERFPRLAPEQAIGLRRVPSIQLQPPIGALTAAAAGVGFSDVNADPDGVYRRPELLKVTTQEGAALPHLATALAAIASGRSFDTVLDGLPGGLRFGDRTVPLINGTLMLQPIARRGGGAHQGAGRPVPTISYVDALDRPPEYFADKIVLVGETATGTTDVRPNPLDNGLRGVELVAEIIANLLYLPPVRPLSGALQWVLILLAIGAPLWLYTALPARPAAGGSIVTLLVCVGLMEAAFWSARLVPAWAPVLVGALGSTLTMGIQRLIEEEQAKRQLRASFSMYVAPELVAEIVEDPAIAMQEGARQRVAVLFSDIRSFTTYCENNPPELVVRQMREYLGGMADSVDRYRGVLDKYIGDAVMALFGPFMEDAVNASAFAVLSALDMFERLEAMNERWAAEGLPQLRIGIGIHVGDAVVGNIGSPRRMQYTALGDAVNLASRLESNTKELGAPFVVSEDVKAVVEELLKDRVEFRDLGTITVKNRAQPVRVYEVRRRPAREETGDATVETGSGSSAER